MDIFRGWRSKWNVVGYKILVVTLKTYIEKVTDHSISLKRPLTFSAIEKVDYLPSHDNFEKIIENLISRSRILYFFLDHFLSTLQ